MKKHASQQAISLHPQQLVPKIVICILLIKLVIKQVGHGTCLLNVPKQIKPIL